MAAARNPADMPAMSVSTTPAAEEIQRQMRSVRSELRDDVQDIVESARVMTDWQYYVRSYPWLCLGAAAAAGYLLVPSRVQVFKPDSQTLANLVRQHQVAVKTEVKPQPSPGLLGGLVNMAAGAALQGAMAIASRQLNLFLQGLAAPPTPPSATGGAATGGADHAEPNR
jgi:hypothetical protein